MMNLCVLSVRAHLFLPGEKGVKHHHTRTGRGTKTVHFPTLPRVGEILQMAQSEGEYYSVDFTVKNVIYKFDTMMVISGYEIDLGAAQINDADAFDKGMERWRKLGFHVSVEERPDAS